MYSFERRPHPRAMARRKPPPSNHDFRHGLLDIVERHLVWPMGTRATGPEIEGLHQELGSAFTARDLDRAVAAAAKYGYSRITIERAWYGR